MKKTISLLLVLVLGLAIGEMAQAATITIGPGADYDFHAIQAGIDAANDGDEVLVAPGEYVITEPITFRGKAITVVSEVGPDETTIRMGTPDDPKRASVVVFEDNETDSSVLDGFTITAGTGCWCTDPYPPGNRWSGHAGGGILCWEASPTIVACMITQNRADWGGGLLCIQSVAILIDCIIVENSTVENGGGMLIWCRSSMTLTNCIIRGNSANVDIGGVGCWDRSSVILTSCTIADNTAGGHVGGVGSFDGSSVTMKDCIVKANTAIKGVSGGLGSGYDNASITMTGCTIAANNSREWSGGGVACLHNTSVSMIHCTITGNTAREGGGGMLIYDQSSATVSNCIIARNRAFAIGGGGIWCGNSSATAVTNSIIWGNTAPKGNEISVESPASALTIAYCTMGGGKAEVDVESGCTLDWGVGNIDADPLFARLDYLDDRGTHETSDDVWVEGDFHLKSQAGRWDPNSQTWIQDDVTSPCIDAGDPMSPIGRELFPNGGFVNMGAYGGTTEASKTYFGEPICETIVAGDINGDGQVNRTDLEIMALHWTDDEPLPVP